MPERIIGFFPFLLMGSAANGEFKIKMNTARIVEAVLIAIVSGALSGYISMKQLEVKVDVVSKQLDKIESRMNFHIDTDKQ